MKHCLEECFKALFTAKSVANMQYTHQKVSQDGAVPEKLGLVECKAIEALKGKLHLQLSFYFVYLRVQS